MLDLAWKNIWMRKVRTILTILAIGVALELVLLLTTILDFTERSMQGELARYAGQIYVRSQAIAGVAGQEFPPISSALKEEEAQQIVQEVAGRVDERSTTLIVFRQLAPPPFPNAPSQALAVGVESDKVKAYAGDEVSAKEGVLNFSSPQAREVMLGPGAALFFKGPGVGDYITVAGERLQVVALVEGADESDRVIAPLMLMPIKTAQEVFNHPGTVSAVLITAYSVSDIAPLAEGIRERHPRVSVLTQEEMVKNLDKVLAGERFFFNLVNYIVYAVAAIVVLIVMVMAVTERTREIGTLRAIGGSRWLVLRTIVLEAMLMGFIGGALAIPILFLLDSIIGFGLTQVVQAWSVIQIVVAAVLLSMVAALLPAWRATRIDPVEALHYE